MAGVHFCLLWRASSAGKLNILHNHIHFLLSCASSREKAVDSQPLSPHWPHLNFKQCWTDERMKLWFQFHCHG
jgi:hypothetical protein